MLIFVGIAFLLPAFNKARTPSKRGRCSSMLKQIGLGLIMYSSDHKGAFPDSLTDLEKEYTFYDGEIGSYISDGRNLYCPSLAKDADEVKPFDGYIYAGKGLRDHYPESQTTRLAYDQWINHEDFRNVLYADGHVEGENWQTGEKNE